ncbi:MAG: glycosyltransferase [Rhodospirillaceae bacterium]|nr:glycosyltransferase [Rhodospirillaceae bacterium]
MRLLQTLAGAAHGGAELFFEDLAGAFARAGVDQHLVIRAAPERLAKLRRLNAGLDTLPFAGPLDVFSPWRLQRIARRFKPDVILGWMNRACRAMPSGNFVRVGRLGGYYNLKYYRSCDALICNTVDIRDYVVREGWPAERAFHIPNFSPVEDATPLPRTSFDTPPEAKILLVLARLERVKGIDTAIAALAHIPDAVLWIAGEGGLLNELRNQARGGGVLDRVRFLGWRADRGALLRTADVCLVPSRHEPFGNVVVNAWAQGTPLVASRSEGPGALIADGEDGLLVPVDDAVALASAAKRVLADRGLAQRLVAGGRRKSRDTYSEAAVVARYLEVFRALTAARADLRPRQSPA